MLRFGPCYEDFWGGNSQNYHFSCSLLIYQLHFFSKLPSLLLWRNQSQVFPVVEDCSFVTSCSDFSASVTNPEWPKRHTHFPSNSAATFLRSTTQLAIVFAWTNTQFTDIEFRSWQRKKSWKAEVATNFVYARFFFMFKPNDLHSQQLFGFIKVSVENISLLERYYEKVPCLFLSLGGWGTDIAEKF